MKRTSTSREEGELEIVDMGERGQKCQNSLHLLHINIDFFSGIY